MAATKTHDRFIDQMFEVGKNVKIILAGSTYEYTVREIIGRTYYLSDVNCDRVIAKYNPEYGIIYLEGAHRVSDYIETTPEIKVNMMSVKVEVDHDVNLKIRRSGNWVIAELLDPQFGWAKTEQYFKGKWWERHIYSIQEYEEKVIPRLYKEAKKWGETAIKNHASV